MVQRGKHVTTPSGIPPLSYHLRLLCFVHINHAIANKRRSPKLCPIMCFVMLELSRMKKRRTPVPAEYSGWPVVGKEYM